MAEAGKPDYTVFNRFQTYFYTSITEFEKFSNFEIKEHCVALLLSMGKGFPNKANEILEIYSPFVKFNECPSLIKALQRSFVNNFSRARVPQHVYYKQNKPKSLGRKPRAKKVKDAENLLEFSEDIQLEIKSILFYDSKTYEYLKHSEKVQMIGKALIEEFDKKEIIRMKKAKVK